MTQLSKIALYLRTFLASNLFFYIVLGSFLIGAAWIASASLYPMAFDEEFHLGLIKIYATALMPYGIATTAEMAQYGTATADTSYLFHYLMSFPYRIYDAIGLSEETIIVLLRFINVALMAGALLVFRKGMLVAGLGRSLVHVSLALFMLIPVLPMLAGQINYDNLLMLIVALAFLFTAQIWRNLQQHASLPLSATWLLLITLLFGIAVKYAFLPIAVSFGIWLLVAIIWHKRSKSSRALMEFISRTASAPGRIRAALAVLLLLGVFFAARYPVNYVQYGNPIPSCDQVFSKEACRAYGPWYRNRLLVAERPADFQPLSFTSYITTHWLPGMAQRLTFAVAGKTNDFQTKKPLPVLLNSLIFLSILGSSALLYQSIRRRARLPFFIWLTLGTTALYCGILAVRLYGGYVSTAEPVAINGRYLLLLLPLVSATLIWAISQTISQLRLNIAKPFLVIVVLGFLIIAGGGLGTYIILSEPHWYWDGWGKSSHAVFQTIYSWFTLR